MLPTREVRNTMQVEVEEFWFIDTLLDKLTLRTPRLRDEFGKSSLKLEQLDDKLRATVFGANDDFIRIQ